MSTARNVAYSMVNNATNVISSVAVIPWVTRALGVEGFGAAGFAQTYAEMFTFFISLGIPLYGVREISRCGSDARARRAVVSELFHITLITTAIFTVVYAVSILSVEALRMQWRFLATAGSLLLFMPFNVDWYFTGRENMWLVMWRNLIFKTLGMVAIFVFVRDKGDVMLYLVFGVMLSGGSLLWTFTHMLRGEVRLRWRGLRTTRHLRPVMYLFFSTVAAVAFTKLDTVMLGLMTDNTQVGFYHSAVKANKALLPIVIASAAALIPRISALWGQGDHAELGRVTRRSFSLISLMAPPVAMGIFAIAPTFVPLYFGAGFEGAVPAMRILSMLVLLASISNFYGNQSLVATGRDREFMWAMLAGTAANLVLNLLFIPRWGAVGAAVASVASEAVILTVTMIWVRKLMPAIRPDHGTLLRSVCASLPMIFWGWLFTRCVDSASWAVAAIVACSIAGFALVELSVFRDSTALEIVERVRRAIFKK